MLFREERTETALDVAKEIVRGSVAAGRGAVLSASQIRALLRTDPPLLEQFIDLDTQLQPNGFDLTLAQVERFVGAGRVDFSNAERRLSEPASGGYRGYTLQSSGTGLKSGALPAVSAVSAGSRAALPFS